MTKTHKSTLRRPVDRLDVAIGGLMILCLLSLATLAYARVISESWIPKFLLGWLAACAVLYVASRLLEKLLRLLIRERRRHRVNVPDNPPMQQTGDDGIR